MADNPPRAGPAIYAIYFRALTAYNQQAFRNPAISWSGSFAFSKAACRRAHMKFCWANYIPLYNKHVVAQAMHADSDWRRCKSGEMLQYEIKVLLAVSPLRSRGRQTRLFGCVKRMRKGPIECGTDSLTCACLCSNMPRIDTYLDTCRPLRLISQSSASSHVCARRIRPIYRFGHESLCHSTWSPVSQIPEPFIRDRRIAPPSARSLALCDHLSELGDRVVRQPVLG